MSAREAGSVTVGIPAWLPDEPLDAGRGSWPGRRRFPVLSSGRVSHDSVPTVWQNTKKPRRASLLTGSRIYQLANVAGLLVLTLVWAYMTTDGWQGDDHTYWMAWHAPMYGQPWGRLRDCHHLPLDTVLFVAIRVLAGHPIGEVTDVVADRLDGLAVDVPRSIVPFEHLESRCCHPPSFGDDVLSDCELPICELPGHDWPPTTTAPPPGYG